MDISDDEVRWAVVMDEVVGPDNWKVSTAGSDDARYVVKTWHKHLNSWLVRTAGDSPREALRAAVLLVQQEIVVRDAAVDYMESLRGRVSSGVDSGEEVTQIPSALPTSPFRKKSLGQRFVDALRWVYT